MMRGIGKSIIFKWMVFSILLATVPLAISGYSIIQIYQKNERESIIKFQKEKAVLIVEKTRGFIERIGDFLFNLSKEEDYWTSLPNAKGHLKRLLYQRDYFSELSFLDEKGWETVRVSKHGQSDLRNRSDSNMFKMTSMGRIYCGDFYFPPDGVLTIGIAVPVLESNGKLVGVLNARVQLRYLSELIKQIKIGEKGFAYVVDRDGFLIAQPEGVNIQLGPFIDRVIAGEEGSLEFENIREEKFLVVYKPIPELKWGVVVQVPVEEAYEPIKEITRTSIKWIIIASILALAFSLFLARRLTFPIKQLSGEMAKVSKGNLDVRIEPTTKDEIGILVESFNRMIQDLKQSQEAIQKAEEKYHNIFENSKDMIYITSADGTWIDVNQSGVEMFGYTSREELMKIPVKDIYFDPEERKGFQSEIATKGFVKDFEVKLKRKDGTRIEVLITATVRRDEEGQITGYEGNIKDISVRKEMEKELVQRRDEIQTLYDLSSLFNQSLELDRVIPLALEKVLTLTGFEMGTIYLVSDDGQWLELKFHKYYPSHLAEAVKRLKTSEGVVGSAVKEKEIVIFSIDEYPSPRILPNLIEEKVRTLVGIPLLSKGEAIGAICLTSRSNRFLGQNEIHLLESLGNQIGMVLENAKLFSSISKAKSEWETTFDTVTDLITIRDRDYRILRANKAAFERWGLGPDKIIGKKCYEILHDLSSPCEACYVTETLKTERPASGERESQYLNGVFQYYTYPIHDESGEVVAVVDLAREITEEKRLEKEKEVVNQVNKVLASSLDVRGVMKAVHTELKKILSSNRMTVTLIDEGGKKFRYFALEKDCGAEELSGGVLYPMEGTSFEKVVEMGLLMVILDTAESDSYLDQKLLKEGIRSSLVYPLEYKGKIIGTMNFGSKEPSHFSEKHFDVLRQIAPGMAISIQNALLLDEIRGSEEKYRTVVEGALDGVLIVGDDYRFKFVNERLAEMLGYTRKELIGMDFREVLDEESRALVMGRYVRRQRGEDVPPQYEFNVIRKDGEVRNVEISSSVIKDDVGMTHTIAFLKDITEKKKMEEQLLQTEKLRALGEMASGVAHDFNNALAAILGNTQLLLYSVQEEEVREALKTIEKVARDSAQTVKRLQEFTRKRSRQELFKLDVNSIVKDAIEITKPKWRNDAQGKGVHIEVLSSFGEVPSVSGDASELREVITNLIFNAVEAMPHGGKIEFYTLKKGGDVHIRIADTGIGMDEETRKKIFEPFFTTKPFSNTGLGLSMSYGIIRRFNGEIEVESRVGSGTAFSIVLPVSVEGREAVAPHAMIKPAKSARILVIDDEVTVREVLEKMLSQVDHRVTVAQNGDEGIRLFQEKEFDIVLTDLGMPGMSGWEVCQKIKKMNPYTPVGMITGWGMEVSQSKMEECGLDFIIAKPFDFNQIIRVVSEKIEPRT